MNLNRRRLQVVRCERSVFVFSQLSLIYEHSWAWCRLQSRYVLIPTLRAFRLINVLTRHSNKGFLMVTKSAWYWNIT